MPEIVDKMPPVHRGPKPRSSKYAQFFDGKVYRFSPEELAESGVTADKLKTRLTYNASRQRFRSTATIKDGAVYFQVVGKLPEKAT